MNCQIKLIENSVKKRCPIYRRSPKEHEIIKEKVQKLLAKNIIAETTSEYICPVIAVKKNGTTRFCVDYR